MQKNSAPPTVSYSMTITGTTLPISSNEPSTQTTELPIMAPVLDNRVITNTTPSQTIPAKDGSHAIHRAHRLAHNKAYNEAAASTAQETHEDEYNDNYKHSDISSATQRNHQPHSSNAPTARPDNTCSCTNLRSVANRFDATSFNSRSTVVTNAYRVKTPITSCHQTDYNDTNQQHCHLTTIERPEHSLHCFPVRFKASANIFAQTHVSIQTVTNNGESNSTNPNDATMNDRHNGCITINPHPHSPARKANQQRKVSRFSNTSARAIKTCVQHIPDTRTATDPDSITARTTNCGIVHGTRTLRTDAVNANINNRSHSDDGNLNPLNGEPHIELLFHIFSNITQKKDRMRTLICFLDRTKILNSRRQTNVKPTAPVASP